MQTLSPQQVLQVRLLEMPVSELEQRVKNEMIDNGALEERLGTPDENESREEDLYDAAADGGDLEGEDGGLPIDDYRPAAELYPAAQPTANARDTLRYPVKIKPGEHIALNAADTTALKRVPGIGSGFARAIIRYRERLGGFYTPEQLLEIDNFPQASLTYFTADASACRKLNVNKLTLSQLRRHPYIGFYQAKTIIDHRRLHGPIHSLDDLSLYKDFTKETIEKLRNYLTF